MDPEMITKLETEISMFHSSVVNDVLQLRALIEGLEGKNGKSQMGKSLIGITDNIEKHVNKIHADSRKVVRNLVADAHKKEVAEVNRIRLESYPEPKAPKYLSTIGTTVIAAGGALFSSLFILTNDLIAATIPFILLFFVGLFLIILSVVFIIRYDLEIRSFHETLLLEPFEDMIIEGGNEPPKSAKDDDKNN